MPQREQRGQVSTPRNLFGVSVLLTGLFLLIFVLKAALSTKQTGTSETEDVRPEATNFIEPTGFIAPSKPESNQVLEPYDLSKNPYKWQGQTGILDTVLVSIPMPNGQVTHVPYPGGGLRFEKMIDANTATFSVLVGGSGIFPEGEIAVLLPDSEPPNPMRPWRVSVEGPMEGSTALGAQVKVTAVRFRGYYSPPAPTVTASNSQQNAVVDLSATSSAISEKKQSDDESGSAGGESPESAARQIGGSVSAPIVLFQPEPDMPEQAKKDKVSGSVLVRLEVDASGKPKNVRVLRSLEPELDESALAAVRQYRFKAAVENGQPVPVEMNVEVSFQAF